MKKRVLLKVSLVIVLGLTGLVSYRWRAWWTGPRNGINQEAVEQIGAGMKLEDVEAIIGGRPGYYKRPTFMPTIQHHFRFRDPPNNVEHPWWVSDNGRISVSFKDGVVTEAQYTSSPWWTTRSK